MINNNRQAGRRRGRGGQQQRPQGNSGGVRDNGNRIDNRSRGNAAQLLEKYKALARDSQMSGDRVNTEYYLQFADHYFRVLAETRSRFEENNRPPQQGGANTFQDDETEYDDDGAPIVAEPSRQNGVQQNGNQNYQGDRQERPDRQERQDRPDRQDRQVSDRQVSDRQTSDRQDRPERPDRQVNDRGQQGDDRPRRSNGNGSGNVNNAGTSYGNEGERYVRDDRGSRNEGRNEDRPEGRPEGRPASGPESRPESRNEGRRYQSEDRAPVQHEAVVESAPVVDEQPVEAPRRRGRPRREPVAEAPVAFDSAILPPSLNISAVTPTNIDSAPANDATGDELEEKPRRRRGRPPASETSTAG